MIRRAPIQTVHEKGMSLEVPSVPQIVLPRNLLSSCRLLQHACSKKRLPDALSVPRYIGIEVVKEVDI